MRGRGDGAQWICVAGIGVNVNTAIDALPAELQRTAATLHDCDGKVRDIRALANAILVRLAVWIDSSPQAIINALGRS